MQIAKRHGKLVGILNGCEYPAMNIQETTLPDYLVLVEAELLKWMSKQAVVQSSHYIAHQRLRAWSKSSWQGPLITSVGRLTDQKALLLRQPFANALVLDELAKLAAANSGRIIILGSGDKYLESVFTQVMARNENLLYLSGYGQDIGDMLYHLGDLFLMPSSFEPCGISQMLAMRAGQPCLVHQVGGLADTVKDLENGFSFSGEDLAEQVSQLLEKFNFAINMYADNQTQYQQLASNAAAARYTWLQAAHEYIDQLYQ